MLASVLERFLRGSRVGRLTTAFVLGLLFSLIGIFLSFQTHFGFAALFIISIAILPVIFQSISLSELLSGRVSSDSKHGVLLEDIQLRRKRWSVRQFFSDFWPLFELYLAYFLTVFFVFVVLGSLVGLDSLSSLFSGQFGFFNPGSTVSFQGLLSNNIGVLLLGFLFSFVFEFGTTFVVIRNSIFWGLTLGLFINSFSGAPLGLLLILPHLVLEASSYFVSSIAGGVLSRAVVEEKIESERFYSLFTQVIALLVVSVLLVVLAAGIETVVFNLFFSSGL
jgi:uncharacterized membrane protein SpoIIM required for sporulation